MMITTKTMMTYLMRAGVHVPRERCHAHGDAQGDQKREDCRDRAGPCDM